MLCAEVDALPLQLNFREPTKIAGLAVFLFQNSRERDRAINVSTSYVGSIHFAGSRPK
jgi:hypothetical protein